MNKNLPKIILIFIVTVGAVFFGLNYLFLSGTTAPKSKASLNQDVVLWFDPGSGTVAANSNFETVAKVKAASTDVSMRGYEMKYVFDPAKLQLQKIEYKLGVVSADLGATDANLATINSSGKFTVQGEVNSEVGQVINTSGAEVAKLTFKVITTSGTTVQVASNFYTINSDKTLNMTVISSPTTIDVNGGGAIITGTGTVTPGSGNTTINMKLKFQGITGKPADALNAMNVKVKLTGCGLTTPVETTAKFVADDKGVWSGSPSVNLSTCTTGGYIIFVKGPRHIQKKICDAVPTEASAATYRCGTGNITLVTGQNNLDFSGILFLSGDLDQNGTVDSADIAFVRNNLGKTEADVLSKADINLDGKIDTQDYSLVISALSIKVDEM